MLYVIAAYIGYPRGEIGSLTKQSFDFDSDPPTVSVLCRSQRLLRRLPYAAVHVHYEPLARQRIAQDGPDFGPPFDDRSDDEGVHVDRRGRPGSSGRAVAARATGPCGHALVTGAKCERCGLKQGLILRCRRHRLRLDLVSNASHYRVVTFVSVKMIFFSVVKNGT